MEDAIVYGREESNIIFPFRIRIKSVLFI